MSISNCVTGTGIRDPEVMKARLILDWVKISAGVLVSDDLSISVWECLKALAGMGHRP